jgi:RimJ/RimL family protein N-acetyltransferase
MILKKTKKENNFSIELHSFSSVEKSSIAPIYLTWLNDLEVVKPIASPILLKEKNSDFIDESFARFTAKNCQGFFIKDLSDKKFIGTAKLDKIDFYNKSAEIGIMIGDKTKWGKGIALQVWKLLMDHAFSELKVHRLWGGTNANNEAMKKVFLKTGFKQEGFLRDACVIDGKYVGVYLYSILKNEYESQK